jgi:hypothetical protein
MDTLPAGNHDRPGLREQFQASINRHARTVLTTDSAPPESAGRESVPSAPKLRPGKPEYFGGTGEFKRAEAVIGEGDDQRLKVPGARAQDWHYLIGMWQYRQL